MTVEVERIPPVLCNICSGSNVVKVAKGGVYCDTCGCTYDADFEKKVYPKRGNYARDPRKDTGDYIEGTEGVWGL